MNVRRLATKGLLCAAIAVGTLPIASTQAFAGNANQNGNNNFGCGAGFAQATVGWLADYAHNTYTASPMTLADWSAYFTGLDANGSGSLCWHQIGKLCPCGANAINVVDDNANATFE